MATSKSEARKISWRGEYFSMELITGVPLGVELWGKDNAGRLEIRGMAALDELISMLEDVAREAKK